MGDVAPVFCGLNGPVLLEGIVGEAAVCTIQSSPPVRHHSHVLNIDCFSCSFPRQVHAPSARGRATQVLDIDPEATSENHLASGGFYSRCFNQSHHIQIPLPIDSKPPGDRFGGSRPDHPNGD